MKNAIRMTGLVAFVGSIVILFWWWATVAGSGDPGGGMTAAAIDAVLFSLFALHHSLLARRGAKQLVERFVPSDMVRTSYVLSASVLLVAMCGLWQPVGGTVYRAAGLTAAVLMLLQSAGALIGVLAVRRISVRELAGVTAPGTDDQLERRGPYRLVRHPLYLGWILVFACTPNMTGDRLVFAVVSSAYLLVAMPFEEAGLLQQFGNGYLEYRRLVRWRLIPYIH
jgi:methanethiol S-methyltransferase